MSCTQPFMQNLGLITEGLSKREIAFIEINLFFSLCDELKNYFRESYNNYFDLTNVSNKKEDVLLDEQFIQFLIKDILATDEYTLSGIALHTQIPEDLLYEVMMGFNNFPSIRVVRQLMELHRQVKKEFYQKILRKIIKDHSTN